jgi:hypothetical protein
MKSGHVIQDWNSKSYLAKNENNETVWVEDIKRAKEFATQEEAKIALKSLPESVRATIINPQIVVP